MNTQQNTATTGEQIVSAAVIVVIFAALVVAGIYLESSAQERKQFYNDYLSAEVRWTDYARWNDFQFTRFVGEDRLVVSATCCGGGVAIGYKNREAVFTNGKETITINAHLLDRPDASAMRMARWKIWVHEAADRVCALF